MDYKKPAIINDERVKAAKCGDGNQYEEAPIPPPVEKVACCHYKQVLPLQGFEHKPIKQENRGQEYEEFKRVEQHSRR